MSENVRLTGRQIAAGRVLAGLGQEDLARSAGISAPTLRRMEGSDGPASGMTNNVSAIRSALEAAGVIFVEENGEGPGVRLRKAKTSNEPIYADASRSAVLNHGVTTVNCHTLHEAVLEFGRLPPDRQSIVTIVSLGRKYTAAEIRRLHYGPRPGSGAQDCTIPVEDLNASNDE